MLVSCYRYTNLKEDLGEASNLCHKWVYARHTCLVCMWNISLCYLEKITFFVPECLHFLKIKPCDEIK